MKSPISRRTVLRGAGVALSLPFLESLAPRGALAQAAMPKRFMVIFHPNGTATEYWKPLATGEGAAWNLSPILEPLFTLKDKVSVLSGFENYSCTGTDPEDKGSSHGRRPGCFLTSANVLQLQQQNNGQDVNGPSVDYLISQKLAGTTPLASLELGLGTSENACDGPPCSYSRSISWKGMTGNNAPEINPAAAFDRIVGAGLQNQDPQAPDPLADHRRAMNQSVLDAVIDNTASVNQRMGAVDKAKMDEFLTSVRASEQRVVELGNILQSGLVCSPVERPTMPAEFLIANGQNGYDKGMHADIMNDLIVMAFQCDVTRVITHMMEHERSEFVYDHIIRRDFTETSSTPNGEPGGNYHGAQHGSAQPFASITYWNTEKVAELCVRLAAIEDAPGVSVLDNTLLQYASCMNGGGHYGFDLPVALIGGLGGIFKTNQHVDFGERPHRDLYYTILNEGFGVGVNDFGVCNLGTPIGTVNEVLA